jgi:hypothetical protein
MRVVPWKVSWGHARGALISACGVIDTWKFGAFMFSSACYIAGPAMHVYQHSFHALEEKLYQPEC